VSLPPGGYTVRPATRDDIDGIAGLVQAVDLHDAGVVEPVRDLIEDDWAHPRFDSDLDTLLVHDGAGSLSAYAQVWGLEPTVSLDAWILVDPEDRGGGLGSWLLTWAEARARSSLTEQGSSTALRPSFSGDDPVAARLLEARGYRHVRTFWHMDRLLDGTETAGEPPRGVWIRVLGDGEGPVLHRLLESAFKGHFGFEPMPYPAWERAVLRLPSVDPSLVFLAERDGEVVGGLIAGHVEDESWVHELGVLEEHRGLGIGRALLRRVFAELASRGRTKVKLNVDGENRTGAPRLYGSAGMRAGRSWLVYEMAIRCD
jgi:ribosomal protein S18 acetylase RimI-like enzyme